MQSQEFTLVPIEYYLSADHMLLYTRYDVISSIAGLFIYRDYGICTAVP